MVGRAKSDMSNEAPSPTPIVDQTYEVKETLQFQQTRNMQ